MRTALVLLVVSSSLVACAGEIDVSAPPPPLRVATQPVTVGFAKACPTGALWNGVACTWDAPAAAIAPPTPVQEDLSPEAMSEAVVADALEPRGIGHRSRALVATELQGLESLYRATEARSLDRPLLIRRLAEDYAELEAGVRDEVRRAERRGDQAAAAREEKTVSDASRAAVKDYRMLLDEYGGGASTRFPTDPPSPYPRLDEVRYFLARELDRGGDSVDAKTTYGELLRTVPSSRYAAFAQLALGEEAFRGAASSDFALEQAADAYRRAYEGSRDERVRAAALLRLAQVDERRGERERAREQYGRLASDYPKDAATLLVPDWAK
jgi:TolA-binding protein